MKKSNILPVIKENIKDFLEKSNKKKLNKDYLNKCQESAKLFKKE